MENKTKFKREEEKRNLAYSRQGSIFKLKNKTITICFLNFKT